MEDGGGTSMEAYIKYKRKPGILIARLDREQTIRKFQNIEGERFSWEKGKMHLIRRFGEVGRRPRQLSFIGGKSYLET